MAKVEQHTLRIDGLTNEELRGAVQEAEAQVANVFIEQETERLFDGDIEEDLKTIYIIVKIGQGGYKRFKSALEKAAKKRNKDAKIEETKT